MRIHPLVVNKVLTEFLIHLVINHKIVPVGIKLIDGVMTEIVKFIGKRNLPKAHFIKATLEALAYDEARSCFRDGRQSP